MEWQTVPTVFTETIAEETAEYETELSVETGDTDNTTETKEESKNSRLSVGFIQIMLVISLLTAAALFRTFGGDTYQWVRLRCANLMADPVNYRDVVAEDEGLYDEP